MRKISISLFLTATAVFIAGCGGSTDNSNKNTNVSSPTAAPTVANTNQVNSNAVNSNAAVKNGDAVPAFTDAAEAFAAGNKYFDANQTEKAIDAFKQAVKLNPDLAEAHFKLGVAFALIEMEKESQPEVTANQPVGTKPAKNGKETAKKKDSDKSFEEAVRAYKKLIAKNSKDDAAYFNLGRAYNKLNDDKESEKALRQAVKLKPDDSDYQTELGAILIKFAKYDEALGVLKKALKLDESNSQAQDLIEKAQAGKKRLEYGQPKDKPKEGK